MICQKSEERQVKSEGFFKLRSKAETFCRFISIQKHDENGIRPDQTQNHI